MDILDILQLIFWILMLAVVIVLSITSIREDKKYKKEMAELDKRREEISTPKELVSELNKYRIVKAKTAGNGEKHFVEFYHAYSNTWVTIDSTAHDTYESALRHKEILEQAQRAEIANSIVKKEVVK